ncbi:hypothetical protein [Dyadobacter sp. CY343]|uniref:hypothetical protein n=1 Tax=Dyadobacter sp. CY343 TaxID=2907299 RepID=UPI001F21F44C|nr:hypothetical protein [Dyadobacter sp. CY343]MCE7060659.1 hypothetical protein [Dyadobacter sp. CY343]
MNFYLHFPESPENITDTIEQYEEYLREVQNCIDRCDCQIDAVLIADRDNVQTFQEGLNQVSEILEYIGAYQASEIFDLLLEQSEAKYWNDDPSHDTDEDSTFYKLFSSTNRSFVAQYPVIFKELGERCRQNITSFTKSNILLNFAREQSYAPFISLLIGGQNQKPVLLNIPSIDNFLDLDKWICANMPIRRYNNSDNRHCENHHDYRQGKSPLIGGVGGKAHAALLLKTALGDRRHREYLVNWDSLNNRYIRFESENDPQNQYHGYHLVARGSHLEDSKAVELIPERIIGILRYRLLLKEMRG